jgi:hypothetical protein
VVRNIFYPYRLAYANGTRDEPNQTLLQSIQNIGVLDSNYYSLRAGTDTSMFEISVIKNGSGYIQTPKTIAYVTGTAGFETHSIYVADNTGSLEYNASSTPRTVTFTGLSKVDVFGNVYNNSVTIPAWGSKVLLANGSVGFLMPKINSTLATSGVAGTAFSYNITASNTANSYHAVGLPTGLVVNTITGLVSGTPTRAGIYKVTISATNRTGSNSQLLVITLANPVVPIGIIKYFPFLGTRKNL